MPDFNEHQNKEHRYGPSLLNRSISAREEEMEDIQPFSDVEIKSLILPHKAIECVLGEEDRLMKTVALGRHRLSIVLILLLASIAFAVPYGAVPPLRSSWKVVALYTGSMMICFPSLYVFGQYLHSKWTLTQTVVLSLVITTVASIFSFSFFPIVWFISYTTDPTSASSIVLPISGILLTASFLLGTAQMARCVAALRGLTDAHGHLALLFAWVALLAFITFRMACHVGAISW